MRRPFCFPQIARITANDTGTNNIYGNLRDLRETTKRSFETASLFFNFE